MFSAKRLVQIVFDVLNDRLQVCQFKIAFGRPIEVLGNSDEANDLFVVVEHREFTCQVPTHRSIGVGDSFKLILNRDAVFKNRFVLVVEAVGQGGLEHLGCRFSDQVRFVVAVDAFEKSLVDRGVYPSVSLTQNTISPMPSKICSIKLSSKCFNWAQSN